MRRGGSRAAPVRKVERRAASQGLRQPASLPVALACLLALGESSRRSPGRRAPPPPPPLPPRSARAFAKKLNDAPLAIVDKRRSAHNVSEVMNLIGDVRGKVAVLVDDMIDTAGGCKG